nr:MAG TPA: hypothetical protein [Caudoviricetes sp.]
MNTFSTPSKLTDFAQTKPSKFKKKGCEKASFLLISCITKKAKDLAGVLARKEVAPRLTNSIFSYLLIILSRRK